MDGELAAKIAQLEQQTRSDFEKERHLLMQRLSYVNERLGYDDRISAKCPSCSKTWNKKVGGGAGSRT